jgi:hypothetical protein
MKPDVRHPVGIHTGISILMQKYLQRRYRHGRGRRVGSGNDGDGRVAGSSRELAGCSAVLLLDGRKRGSVLLI